MNLKNRLFWIAGGLLPIFILMGCSSKSDSKNKYDRSTVDQTPVNGGIYIEASIADAAILNPLLSTDSASSDINSRVFNGLVKYDKDIKLVGDLAKSWDITNGGKTITFHLRENVRWHDGEPFTSADALFTYQMLIASTTRTAFSSDYLIVKKVETPDATTFRVHYNEPFAPAIESWGMSIIPKHIFEGRDINTHPANRHPIGTGPYKFKSWKTDQKIVLQANPDYFDGRPYIDQYVYYVVPDLSVQFFELRQGTLSTMSPTPDQYSGYDKFFLEYDKYRYPGFRYDYIGLNLTREPFTDKRVRKALAHAIDRQSLIDGVYLGMAVPTTGPFPPTSWAYNHDVPPYEYNPEKAKNILKDAGWTDSNGDGILDKDGKPFKFTLITNQGNKVREIIAQILKSDLEKVGIDMDIRLVEWTVFIQDFIHNKNFDATLLAWNLSRDPDAYPIWHSSQTKPGQYNFVSYNNPQVDRLLIEGRTTFDLEKRKKIYNRMHEIIADDLPYIFLVTPESLPVVHKSIVGVQKAPAGIGWNYEKWFIPKKWQRFELAAN